MTCLVLPVAGRSSRYPGVRPKWLLTMPSGMLMIEYALSGLNLKEVERIVIISLSEHGKFYNNDILLSSIRRYNSNVEICALDLPTQSQAETITKGIELAGISGPIFIKDCDNYFEVDISNNNAISYVNLHDCVDVTPGNKSYVKLGPLKTISNVVEKKIISDTFCCGGYQFAEAQDFVSTFQKLQSSVQYPDEIYVSHVVYEMILSGNSFVGIEAENFTDVGTLHEFRKIQRSAAVIFCDIDGVLCENGSKFSSHGWKTEIIEPNLEALRQLQQHQPIEIVVTTARPETEKEYLLQKLESAGLKVKDCIMGLPHGQRILINDFASTNTYPTATAVNIPRNSGNLGDYLQWLKK